jgi:equilibrative nucleoside transporter 1/2/3
LAGLLATLLSFGDYSLTRPRLSMLIFLGSGAALILLSVVAFFAGSQRILMLQTACKIHPSSHQPSSFRRDLRQVRWYACGIFWNFMVTLCVFPAAMAQVESTSAGFDRTSFLRWSFLAFDLGDCLGKWMPALSIFQCGPQSLVTRYLAFSRSVLALLFLTCHIPTMQRAYANVTWFYWLRHDAAFFLLLSLFAISNGYANSLLLMAAPQAVHMNQKSSRALHSKQSFSSKANLMTDSDKKQPEDNEAETQIGNIGACMGLFIVLGLTTGSLASFGVRAIICGCNPFTTTSAPP